MTLFTAYIFIIALILIIGIVRDVLGLLLISFAIAFIAINLETIFTLTAGTPLSQLQWIYYFAVALGFVRTAVIARRRKDGNIAQE